MSNYGREPMYADDSGRHPVNILHLVMGVIFLGAVTVWGLIQAEVASTADLRWLLPLPWMFAGAAGLLVIALSGRRRNAAPATHPVSPTSDWVGGPTTPQK